MIAYISGKLLAAFERNCIVVPNSGTGYEISLPIHTFANLPAIGENVELYLSLVTREDSQELFGFATLEEKRTFEILTGISKVGARTALAVLSIFRPDDIYRLVQEEDYRRLTTVPGIGAKTAQHIFLELKYKLNKPGIARNAIQTASPALGIFSDVLAALENLGYQPEECSSLIREVLAAEPDLDTGSAIRKTLKALGKGKNDG